MRFDLVQKVHLSDPKKTGARLVAIITMKREYKDEYVHHDGVAIVQRILPLLSVYFTEDQIQRGKGGEQNGALIRESWGEGCCPVVIVSNKSWDGKKIDGFISIMRALAELHGWEIEEEEEEDKVPVSLQVTTT